MVWAFLFNTSSYCGDLVMERETKFKYLSHVLGLKRHPYWLANYTFDICLFAIPLVLFFVAAFLLQSRAYFITEVAHYIIIALFFFSFSFIGYSYLFSFMFQKSNTAYRVFPFFNFVFFFSIPQVALVLSKSGVVAQYIAPLASPFIALYACFFTEEMKAKNNNSIYYSNSYLYNIICLVTQSILFITLALFIERERLSLKDRQVLYGHENHESEGEQMDSTYELSNLSPND
jgi:hypothetical protein